jgi:hypothetical protein
VKKVPTPIDPKTIYALAAMNAIHSARRAVYGDSLDDALESANALATALEFIEPVVVCQGLLSLGGLEYDHFWCKTERDIMFDVTADLYFDRLGPLVGHVDVYNKAYFDVGATLAIDKTPSAISAAAEETLAGARATYTSAVGTAEQCQVS